MPLYQYNYATGRAYTLNGLLFNVLLQMLIGAVLADPEPMAW